MLQIQVRGKPFEQYFMGELTGVCFHEIKVKRLNKRYKVIKN
jgi:hypothetical protein